MKFSTQSSIESSQLLLLFFTFMFCDLSLVEKEQFEELTDPSDPKTQRTQKEVLFRPLTKHGCSITQASHISLMLACRIVHDLQVRCKALALGWAFPDVWTSLHIDRRASLLLMMASFSLT